MGGEFSSGSGSFRRVLALRAGWGAGGLVWVNRRIQEIWIAGKRRIGCETDAQRNSLRCGGRVAAGWNFVGRAHLAWFVDVFGEAVLLMFLARLFC